MEVTPKYDPVGKFFEYQPIYRVPAYQRSYSWEQLEIEDFTRDLEVCYNKRKFGNEPMVHFFGQIVCIEVVLQGTEQLKYFELVDGQQRIATFILLITALITIYEEIISPENIGDIVPQNEKGIIEERILDLRKRYIVFQKEVQLNLQQIQVLNLSNRDQIFFTAFIDSMINNPKKKAEDRVTVPGSRESHALIKSAYSLINEKIINLTNTNNLRDRIGNLKTIEQILETDFCILNMVTNDRKAAFKLFQVLNNRGKNLTEGDLLRAECLRMLEPHSVSQRFTEEAWDNILIDVPPDTVEYLKAIYGSYTGQKAGANSLFNEFITQFFPQYEFEHINEDAANQIKEQVKKIEEDVSILRKLSAGQWPFEPRQPIEYWDRHKLYLLVHALNHKECLPFLLSAQLLSQTIYRDLTQMLERFVFRYSIIGNQYIGDLINIYHEEAKIIRDNTGGYTIASLQAKLQPLIERVDDDMFKRQLDDFKFSRLGKSVKPLKYFLLSIEYYHRWFRDGAVGSPTCIDKERVYDFTDSTIEHIYPYNGIGNPSIINHALDPLKNTIGNLTILGNADNRTGDNDDFITKKPIFQDSSLMINRDIAVNASWDEGIIQARTEELKDMACIIFRL